MNYEWFVGLRYLRAKKTTSFISVITFISILGIAVGVMALIIVISVMTGFEEDLKDKILGVNAHIIVTGIGGGTANYKGLEEKIKKTDGVTGTSPFIYRQAMLSSRNSVMGVIVRGMDTKSAGDVTTLPERMKKGSIEGVNTAFGKVSEKTGYGPGIVIGKELSRTLGVWVGDELNVITPLGNTTAVGTVPRIAQFTVSGIFEFGMYEYDSSLAFISIENAQKFFKLSDTVTGIEVKLDDIYNAGIIKNMLKKELGPTYRVRTWMEMNKNLFSALKLEKAAMFIILTLIILVAALNIISTLIMMVMQKGKEIAILKSIGATSGGIMKIFIIEGVIIGVVGTLLGAVLGVVCALNLENVVGYIERAFDFKVLPPSVYYIDKLPAKVEPRVVVIIIVLSLTISFLATLYPSWRASKCDPVEGLRYE